MTTRQLEEAKQLLGDACRPGLSAAGEPSASIPIAWQPIETAPRDGSRFLVINGLGEVSISHRLGFNHFWAGRDQSGSHAWTRMGSSALTHWMPLPLPPQPKEPA